mgnify:CR=1 FL=1
MGDGSGGGWLKGFRDEGFRDDYERIFVKEWLPFVGAVLLVAAGLAGLVPFHLSTARVDLFGADAPWWVPMSVIVVVSTAFSYGTGVFAAEQVQDIGGQASREHGKEDRPEQRQTGKPADRDLGQMQTHHEPAGHREFIHRSP